MTIFPIVTVKPLSEGPLRKPGKSEAAMNRFEFYTHLHDINQVFGVRGKVLVNLGSGDSIVAK